MQCGAITFWGGELKWKFASLRLEEQLRTSAHFTEVKAYSPRELKKLCDDKTKTFIENNQKGYGYWIWKPILVLDFFLKNPHIEAILYLDSGCEFIANSSSSITWKSYVDKLSNFDAVFFKNDLKEICWTKQELFDYLAVSTSEQLTEQLVGGVFLMSKEFALVFCTRWLEIMQANRFLYVNDVIDSKKQKPEFREHRYDQSVLSILAKREPNVCILSGNKEIYFPGNWKNALHKPIWTARNGSYFTFINQSRFANHFRKLERCLNFFWKKLI